MRIDAKQHRDHSLFLIFQVRFIEKKLAFFHTANLTLLTELDLNANVWKPQNCMNGKVLLSVSGMCFKKFVIIKIHFLRIIITKCLTLYDFILHDLTLIAEIST